MKRFGLSFLVSYSAFSTIAMVYYALRSYQDSDSKHESIGAIHELIRMIEDESTWDKVLDYAREVVRF